MLGVSFALFAVERCSLSFEACSNATGSLKLFLFSFPSGINSSILSTPSTLILFYYSTDTVFLLESRSFLPSLPSCDLLEQTVCICFISGLYYTLLQVFQVICWIWLKVWISNWNLFFFFFFISPLVHWSVFSAQKSYRESFDPCSLLVPPAAAMESWAVVTKAHLSCLSPQE